MIEELGDLNEKFYVLCSRLDKYCEKLSDEQYAYMQSVLLEQYKDEYTLLALKCGIETKREIDELEAKHARLVPHRWRFLFWRKKNYAAALNDAQADEYAARVFDEIEKKLAEEMRARITAESAASGEGGESAEQPADDGGDDEPTEDGVDLAAIEAQIAQDAWEKLTESADPKRTKSDASADVSKVPENRDESARSSGDRAKKSP